MRSLVYVSSATRLLSEEDLLAILKVARSTNEGLGITGMLLYQDGNIIQALEGPDEAVQSIYERIESDPRHKAVSILFDEVIVERQFPSWSMGFHKVSELPPEIVNSYSGFLKDPAAAKAFSQDAHPARELLALFRENGRR